MILEAAKRKKNEMLRISKENNMKKGKINKLISMFLVELIILLPVSIALSVSNVQVTDITETSAQIKWVTNESANSIVNYGRTRNLTDTEIDYNLNVNHSIRLSDLDANSTYYFQVRSGDEIDDNSGNYYDFETLFVPLFINVSLPRYTNERRIDILWL